MSVRVRFAPSPTGHLHIGGIRTALYCYLFAQKNGGRYILRIEDTDPERSRREYEESIIDDLLWMGIQHDEGPDAGGEYGPYRQSERADLYRKFAHTLVEEGKAYPCFLSSTELEELTARAVGEKLAPHAYHGFFRDFPPEQASKRIRDGEKYVIRFKNPQASHCFQDLVRREVSFGADMVGDFVILRANGMPVYNFSCVIDDLLMKITHVIRGEEHLPNTLRQLILYQALGESPPTFAHVSLLVGNDGQKLSKRHNVTSLERYRLEGYLPSALANYLCLLGWSHPDEKDIFEMEEIVDIFTPERFNKSSALYDLGKLNSFNGEHMRRLPTERLIEYLAVSLPYTHPFHQQELAWKEKCVEFFKSKFDLPAQFVGQLDLLFKKGNPSTSEEYLEIKKMESSQTIALWLAEQIEKAVNEGKSFVSEEEFSGWMNHIKRELAIKGKPLFKGMRGVLTLSEEGPELKNMIPLTPLEILQWRVQAFLSP